MLSIEMEKAHVVNVVDEMLMVVALNGLRNIGKRLLKVGPDYLNK